MSKLLTLIDGEHYLPVIKAAFNAIRQRGDQVLAAILLGGTEKILETTDYAELGCPVITNDRPEEALKGAMQKYQPEKVVDLSDEPVVGYSERFFLASLVLAEGIPYEGADFSLEPPIFEKIAEKPSLAIIGTGKRVGKTAVSAYACRLLKEKGYRPCVVAMGRGGPEEPEVIAGDEIVLDADYLVKASRAGKHAASDHFEDALMSRIPTVGCRRCGGGLAGAPFISNVLQGARKANRLGTEFIIFEGSGAALPPIATDARVLVCSANQPLEYIVGYLGTYRLFLSDFVVLTQCEEEILSSKESEFILNSIKKVKPVKVVKTIFRPKPLGDLRGEKVFYTTTAPSWVGKKLKQYLEKNFYCEVVGISHHLSNRKLLRQDLKEAEGKFSLLLTELKAASVDIVTERSKELGVKVVYCDNEPVTVGGDGELSQELVNLAEISITRFRHKADGKVKP